jgi:hypothetical protein
MSFLEAVGGGGKVTQIMYTNVSNVKMIKQKKHKCCINVEIEKYLYKAEFK